MAPPKSCTICFDSQARREMLLVCCETGKDICGKCILKINAPDSSSQGICPGCRQPMPSYLYERAPEERAPEFLDESDENDEIDELERRAFSSAIALIERAIAEEAIAARIAIARAEEIARIERVIADEAIAARIASVARATREAERSLQGSLARSRFEIARAALAIREARATRIAWEARAEEAEREREIEARMSLNRRRRYR